jgi:hypothetical protein
MNFASDIHFTGPDDHFVGKRDEKIVRRKSRELGGKKLGAKLIKIRS